MMNRPAPTTNWLFSTLDSVQNHTRWGTKRAVLSAALMVLVVGVALSACGDVPSGSLPELNYAVPNNVYVGQLFNVDFSESSDPEGQELYFSVNFGEGEPSIQSQSRVFEHRYGHEGRFTVAVTVLDARGNKYTEYREISVVRREDFPVLVCQENWQNCPPYYTCEFGDTWLCVPDKEECSETLSCPGELICQDGLCR